MDAFKLALKFFFDGNPHFEKGAFVPVFHSWIQGRAIENHLLIDVADYDHVEAGPGTVLVAHEANYSTDSAGHEVGLLYARKQPLDAADFAGRLRLVFRSALQACRKLEETPPASGPVRFRTDNPLLRIHDRLLAPNEPETYARIKPELVQFLSHLYQGPASVRFLEDPKAVFSVRIAVPASADVATLLARL